VDPPPDGDAAFLLPPLQTSVPTYAIEVDPAILAGFHADPYGPERPAILDDGHTRTPILMRVRGGSSRWYPKKSWRLEFPEGRGVEGRRKLNLVAEMADRTLMVEKLAFDLMLAMGAPAPRTRYVRLVINGVDQGPYLDIERVDKAFARAHGFIDDDPSIYRCGEHDCEFKPTPHFAWQGPWQKETNERTPRDDLDAFLALVNHTPEPDFAGALEAQFEVEAYLRSMTMDALISNDIVMDSGSYLIRDRSTGRWTYVPWDLNNSAARWWPTYGLSKVAWVERPVPVYSLFDPRIRHFYDLRGANHPPGVYRPAYSNLTTRIVLNPRLRARWVDLLERALDELFTPEVLHPRIDAMHALLAPLVATDPFALVDTEGRADPDGRRKFEAGRTYLRNYVSGRRAYLRGRLEDLRTPPPGIVLGAFDPAAGWVDLRNEASGPRSTAGMRLRLDLRGPDGSGVLMPTVTLAPGASLRLTARQLGLTFPDRGTIGLFAGPGVEQALDALFYGPSPRGTVHRRGPEGWELTDSGR